MARLKLASQTVFEWLINEDDSRGRKTSVKVRVDVYNQLKGLILAQNERWRRGLGMQVER